MASERASIVDEWLEDDKLMLLEAWARDYSKSEIAERIGIAPSTLNYWIKKYEPIARAVSNGAEIVDYKVENALLKSALGYTTTEIEVTVGKQVKGGQTFMITKKTSTKEIAPNVTAALAWLNNRRPDKWKRNRDKSIELEEDDGSIQITVLRGPKKEEDDKVNQSVVLEKKKEEGSVLHDLVSKDASQKEDDKDYWPDDWEDKE